MPPMQLQCMHMRKIRDENIRTYAYASLEGSLVTCSGRFFNADYASL